MPRWEYADKNIRVNAIGPGFIVTPLIENAMDEAARKALISLHPIGRLGTAEEVAELALWLGSSKSSFVTGSYYTIDGGYTAR
jgi:NAD(P)-dependent dehydrogenase (short-subunit alcohol dehydrogenase family)